MRMIMFGVLLELSLITPIYAGPYFNAPEGGPEEEVSEYENLLNQARKFIIDMLDNWESDPDAARLHKDEAVNALLQAEEVIVRIGELDETALTVSPDFLLSEVQQAAYRQASATLGSFGLEAPRTYVEIVSQTRELTRSFRETIAGVEIAPFPEGWEQSRRVGAMAEFG